MARLRPPEASPRRAGHARIHDWINANEHPFDTSHAESHRAGSTIQAESVGFDALREGNPARVVLRPRSFPIITGSLGGDTYTHVAGSPKVA